MKRSYSLFEGNHHKQLKRLTTWNDQAEYQNEITTPQNKLIQKPKKLGPMPLLSARSFKPISSKILTSDFWTPTMKLQLRKLSESNPFESGNIKKAPILARFLPDEKFKRIRVQAESCESVKVDIDTVNGDLFRGGSKSKLSQNIVSLDRIIEDCDEQRGKNKKLSNDIFSKRKFFTDEFHKIKKSIMTSKN